MQKQIMIALLMLINYTGFVQAMNRQSEKELANKMFLDAVLKNNFDANHDIMLKAISEGADINAMTVRKDSTRNLLGYAITKNDIKLFEFLLQNNINPNAIELFTDATEQKGWTPYFWVLLRDEDIDKLPFIKLLYKYGADINKKDAQGHTPLHTAVRSENLEAVKFFLSKGAIVNTTRNDGKTPLDSAEQSGNEEIIKMLEDALEKEELSEVMLEAIKNGNKKQAEQLIKDGFDVNFRYEKNMTPLLKAIDANQSDIAELLIKNDAIKLDLQNDTGLTALMLAIKKNLSKIAELLIEKKANLELRDTYGNTPLIHAAHNGNKNYSDTQQKIIKLLIDRGANVNAQNNNGPTALIYAAHNKNKEIVKLLVDAGANVNIKEIKTGQTALHLAANNDDKDMIELLTIHGNAKANIKNKSEKIAADYAKDSKIKTYLKRLAKYDDRNQRRFNRNRINTIPLKQIATYAD